MVEFASNGARAQGYLAEAEGGGPGVIVIQEWWGLVDHIKGVADRFANEGFTALAPDLYHGESTDNPDEAGRLMMALNIDRTATDLGGAINYVLGLDATTSSKVGTVGFCMGGQLALATGCVNGAVGAVVDFYGVHPRVLLDFSGLQAPVLGLFAENDTFVTPAIARKLEETLQEAGATTDFHIYDGVDHAFFNETRPDVYHPESAANSWGRTIHFFREHLS